MRQILTPWGPSLSINPAAPGLVQVRAEDGSGLRLSSRRWTELMHLFPGFHTKYNRRRWLADGRESARAVMAWPELWNGVTCWVVVRSVPSRQETLADVPHVYWLSGAWRETVYKARAWEDSHQGHWVRIVFGPAGDGKWFAVFSRVRDGQQETILLDQRPAIIYSNRELSYLVAGRFASLTPTTNKLSVGS